VILSLKFWGDDGGCKVDSKSGKVAWLTAVTILHLKMSTQPKIICTDSTSYSAYKTAWTTIYLSLIWTRTQTLITFLEVCNKPNLERVF
jgi:hypothetical protein